MCNVNKLFLLIGIPLLPADDGIVLSLDEIHEVGATEAREGGEEDGCFHSVHREAVLNCSSCVKVEC